MPVGLPFIQKLFVFHVAIAKKKLLIIKMIAVPTFFALMDKYTSSLF